MRCFFIHVDTIRMVAGIHDALFHLEYLSIVLNITLPTSCFFGVLEMPHLPSQLAKQLQAFLKQPSYHSKTSLRLAVQMWRTFIPVGQGSFPLGMYSCGVLTYLAIDPSIIDCSWMISIMMSLDSWKACKLKESNSNPLVSAQNPHSIQYSCITIPLYVEQAGRAAPSPCPLGTNTD